MKSKLTKEIFNSIEYYDHSEYFADNIEVAATAFSKSTYINTNNDEYYHHSYSNIPCYQRIDGETKYKHYDLLHRTNGSSYHYTFPFVFYGYAIFGVKMDRPKYLAIIL